MTKFYHASPASLQIGDRIIPGYPANFSDEPSGFVFLSVTLEAAEWWCEFLGGDSMADKLGYWPDVFIYEVEPEGELEDDDWCVYSGIMGCYMSESPLVVTGKEGER